MDEAPAAFCRRHRRWGRGRRSPRHCWRGRRPCLPWVEEQHVDAADRCWIPWIAGVAWRRVPARRLGHWAQPGARRRMGRNEPKAARPRPTTHDARQACWRGAATCCQSGRALPVPAGWGAIRSGQRSACSRLIILFASSLWYPSPIRGGQRDPHQRCAAQDGVAHSRQ